MTSHEDDDQEEHLISVSDAATYSFDIAYQVACAILLESHRDCPGCMICDVITAAKENQN